MKIYEYDIAISFAEEDRNAALALALALELVNMKKVYYYPDVPEAITGKPLKSEITRIYLEKAEFAVALLSDDYLKKDYARLEMKAIRKRMNREPDKAYLIPVLMHPSFIKSMPEIKDIGYVQWEANPKRIAGLIIDKLGKRPDANSSKDQRKLIDLLLIERSNNSVMAVQKVNNQGKSEDQTNINIVNYANGKR